MTTRAELVACARSFLGVRFAHQGRDATGLDCLGLLIVSAERAGITLQGLPVTAQDERTYGHQPDTARLKDKLETFLEPSYQLGIGDILLLEIDGRAQHLALVTDYPAKGFGMIHAYARARKVVEHRLDISWENAIRGIYRLPPG